MAGTRCCSITGRDTGRGLRPCDGDGRHLSAPLSAPPPALLASRALHTSGPDRVRLFQRTWLAAAAL